MDKHDLFLEMLDNPQASFNTMILAGLTPENTSIQNKEEYKNDEWVKRQFSDEFGNFNEAAFNDAYTVASLYYNNLADASYEESVKKVTSSHRSNIFAPLEERRSGPDFQLFKMANPYQLTFGLVTFGKVDEPTKSIDELAQANKVLANPTTAGDNLENAIWEDSPNDSFFGHFFDTLVLAQYDSDGTHIDPISNQTVQHKKGDLKVDSDGNFFYEKLDGRDIYGRSVLNKMNILTTDGSFWNKFDFFDSDDINLKHPVATVLKNAALVGTMFIPGIGPWVRGLSIATLLAGVGATFLKMLADGDTNTLNEIEGFSKSLNRQTARTQYAQEHTWSWENFINLIGDVMGQLAELRFIFERLPLVFAGSNIMTKEGQAAKLKEFQAANKKFSESKISELLKNPKEVINLTKLKLTGILSNTLDSQAQLDSFIKGYLKLGEVFSKGYMTAIVVGDTFGEAKQAGASDTDATLLTLGYAAGEYALLSTGLGEWILPELRANRYRYRAIQRALMNLNEETILLRLQFGNMLLNIPKEGRKQYAKKLFNLGKDIASAEYATGAKTLQATLAAGAGEGFEEVSEELLADFSKAAFNTALWLSGSDTRMTAFGYNYETGEWDTSEIFDRYGMSLIGGAIGGSLTNLATNYRAFNSFSNMTSKQAVEELIYIVRNGQAKEFLKSLDKVELANPYLSATEVQELDGLLIFAPGTKENNLDLYAKQAIRAQVLLILNILDANGASLSDDSFLNKLSSGNNILGELRYATLHKSTMAGAYLNRFNNLSSDIVRLTNNSNIILDKAADTNKDGVVTDREARRARLSEEDKRNYDRTIKELDSKRQELNDLLQGKYTYEFIADALFEMTDTLSGIFTETTLPLFAERHFGKKWSELTENDKNAARLAYENWKVSDGRNVIQELSAIYRDMSLRISNILKKIDQRYIDNIRDSQELTRIITNLSTNYNLPENASSEDILLWLDSARRVDNIVSLERALLTSFGSQESIAEVERIEKLIHEIDSKLPKKEQERQSKELLGLLNTYISRNLIDNVSNYLQPFINRGFANVETKNQLLRVLDSLINISVIDAVLIEKNIPEMALETPPELQELYQKIANLREARKLIEGLDNTLFLQDIDEISISMGNEPINVTLLINRLDTSFKESRDDISKFNIDELLAQDLNNAIYTMLLYKAAVLGARTDSADINDYFGYNATLNEVSKKLGNNRPELAEIDKNTADVLLLDINLNLSRLVFLRNLYLINQGQKLSKQDRISTRKDLLLFNRIRTIVSTPDDNDLKSWNGLLELLSRVNSLSLHSELLKSNSNEVPIDRKEDFQRETIELEDAIYDFFQLNTDKLNDINKLALFVNPKRLLLYTKANELLNEGTTSIDDNSMLWWIASRAAIKSSDFHNLYKQIIDIDSDNPIAPISTLELAVYNNYANILNGNVIVKFYDAFRKALVDDWRNKSVKERLDILRSIGRHESLADDRYVDYAIDIIPVPRYSNTVLTEGIPGAGKSQVVFKITVRMLKQFNPSLLKSVAVVHGSGLSNALNLRNSVELSEENSKAYDRLSWMKEINPQWTEYSIDPLTGKYIVPASDTMITDQNEIVSAQGVREMNNPPSLIMIDEILKFTSYDMDQINNFAKKHGITVLVAGDFDQAGVVGAHSITLKSGESKDWSVNLERTNFIRSPKLGVSMRTDNVIKTRNQEKIQAYMLNPTDMKLDLEYYEDESGLYGDMVISYAIQDDNVADNSVETAKSSTVDTILRQVDKLIDTLNGGKIGYIFSDRNSPIFKALSSEKYSKYIDFREGGTAHGDEGLYYIIEATPTPDLNSDNTTIKSLALETYLKDIYTGITRAQQGSILIIPFDLGPSLGSVRTTSNVSEAISKKSISDYAKTRKNILDQVVTEGKPIPYIPRTKGENIVISKTIIKREGLEDGIDSTPPGTSSTYEDRKLNLIKLIENTTTLEEVDNLINEFLTTESLDAPDQDIANARLNRIAQFNNTPTLEVIPYTNISQDLLPTIQSVLKVARDNPKIDEGLDLNDNDSDLKYGDLIRLTDGTYKVIVGIKLVEDGNHQYYMLDPYSPDGASTYGYTILQYNRSDINGIVLNYQEHGGEVKSDPLVYEDDLTPITDNDVVSDDEYREKIDTSSEDSNLPQSSANPVIEEEVIGISMLLHTFNTFETGVLFDENDIPVPIGVDWQSNPRIDSINGLGKLDLLQGKQLRTKRSYLNLIGNLRNILFNTKDKSELIRLVSSNLGISGTYVTFALKSSPRPGEGNRESNREFVESRVTPFSKGISETTEFNGSSDTRSHEWHSKSIVAIIGTKANGDLVEIPLIATSSPFTLLQISDGNGSKVFAEVYEEYNRLKGQGLSQHNASVELIRKFDGNKKYQDLIDLFKLFNFTDRGIFYIKDNLWTPANNLTLMGPLFVINRGYYQGSPGFEYDKDSRPETEWTTIDLIATNPLVRMTSKVLVSISGEVDAGNGTSVKIAKAGNPFVLVSFDKSLNTDSKIIDYYVRLIAEPDTPKKVQIMYVMRPKASIDEYIENIRKIFSNEDGVKHIGLLFTSYKLMKVLLGNDNFRLYLDKRLPNVLSRLDQAIQELDSLPNNTERKNKLYELQIWPELSNKPRALVGLFDGALMSIVYNKNTLNSLIGGEILFTFNQEGLLLIKTVLLQSGIDGVRYNVHIPRINPLMIGPLYVPTQGDGYTTDGKPFRIHGKIDSYTFKSDISWLVRGFLSSLRPGRDGHAFNAPDGYNYFNGRSDISQPISAELRAKNSATNYIRLKTGLDLTEIYENNQIELANTIAVQQINSNDNNQVAFVINNRLVISNKSDILGGQVFIMSGGNGLTDISLLNDNNGVYYFTLEANGTQYNAEYNSKTSELTLSLIELSNPNPVALSVNPDNFDTYINDARVILEELFEYDPDYEEVFRSTSYQEFIDRLNNMDYIGEDRINDLLSILDTKEDLTPLLRLIINEMIEVERSHDDLRQPDSCQTNIKIKF